MRLKERNTWNLGLVMAAALPLAILACSDDDHPAPDGGLPDGGTDGGQDASGPSEPQPLPVSGWVGATVSAESDPVYGEIEKKTFNLPEAGSGYLGLNWVVLETGENGRLARPRVGLFYAAVEMEVPPGHRVFARGDSVYDFFVDNAAFGTGDYYHSRMHRQPLGAGEGSHLLVVRAFAQASAAEVELWSTDAEVVWNPADLTLPDLRAGRADEAWLGVAVLHLGEEAATDVIAEVLDGTAFSPTSVTYPALGPDALTQVSFRLQPKPAGVETADRAAPARLRLSSASWRFAYETGVDVPVVAESARFRKTRRSGVDHSTQYAGVMPPSAPAPTAGHGLILSLHGAGVEASGQAAAYSPKGWAYLVAPTNRRRFGFDWEEWGRLDAIEALEDAIAAYSIDPERTHLTGHSMGGHGTWNVGVHHAWRFGVIAPSAGWISFELYSGPAHPSGVIGRARQGSQTLDFIGNLGPKTVYIIHGDADDNVPVTHARQMFDALGPIVSDLTYHEEPGAGHWWDLDPEEEGADCVDWEPMIARMENARRDTLPLVFSFTSPGPFVNPTHSFVTLESAESPMANMTVDSSAIGSALALTTSNVRSMTLDGEALSGAGIASLTVDGQAHALAAGPIVIGPQTGKRAGLHGPLNQVYQRPFCFVYDEDGPAAYRHYAAYLLSTWSILGNGHGCALPLHALPSGLGEGYNLIFLGVAPSDLPGAPALPFDWSPTSITAGASSHQDAALAFVYPAGERLHAYYAATEGSEYLLFRYTPFSSRAGMPDFLLWAEGGVSATGFFDSEWDLDPAFAQGL
ncbi:MAG: prolyl oligopeptidase family serine peptidase [Polyangia bacterium]|jgi:predicted esterase|nr:prolyl oligopeptidase family serine peptidase [Polyangia bacterium]